VDLDQQVRGFETGNGKLLHDRLNKVVDGMPYGGNIQQLAGRDV